MFSLIPSRSRAEVAPRMVTEPFEMMRREFGPLFDRFFGEGLALWPEVSWERFWGVTFEEGEREVVARFELPGFEPSEVNVHLRGNVLMVEAEHGVPEGKEGEEVEKRHVRREVTLPEGLELEKTEATYRNGILEVHIPRTPEAEGRKIEVKG